MSQGQILWVDDEIDLIKPYILFLEDKGYQVEKASNGLEALEIIEKSTFDLIFLDESMPGMSGLELLQIIKTKFPLIPIVMITKNEEEGLMEDAIGSQISDYLIKPVKPQQILSTIKKILDNKKLILKTTSTNYQKEFQNLYLKIQSTSSYADWVEIYKNLLFWELELEKSDNQAMFDMLRIQKKEANNDFSKFIQKNYQKIIDEEEILMSPNIMSQKVFPLLSEKRPIYFVLIDNLRFDQLKVIQSNIYEYFQEMNEMEYLSILPTTTQYARNSIFSGLYPIDIVQKYPQYWVGDDEIGSKNNHEDFFLKEQIKRIIKFDCSHSFHKISSLNQETQFISKVRELNQDINVVIYNFIDMLSHSRNELEMMKQLIKDDTAFRGIAKTWFQNSSIKNLLQFIKEKKGILVLTTDHGTIQVQKPLKCQGDKQTNPNIRYKNGKNLVYPEKEVFVIKSPEKFKLPSNNLSTNYIFATNQDYLIYQNNYNQFANLYLDSFQHGGISLEEMICPLVIFR
ncbi:MAG: response regulator [Chitinophagales bacterium]|jgi:CheY-like chemotaxis protein|nr:response regulator [Chitinophagales bacterium]